MPLPCKRRSPSHSSDSESSHFDPECPALISQIYRDANDFDAILRPSDSASYHWSNSDAFDHLVAKDLDSIERAAVGRSAKLNVASSTWTDGELTTEPESYSEDMTLHEETCSEPQDECQLPEPEFHRTATKDDDSWKLGSGEIIDLLVEEFGPIAPDGETEKLIFEADGVLYMDVLILGVLHLTTHRLAFHASLLSTRPDLPPSQQVIKSGSAMLHGPFRSRRLHLELSHDMLCTYASSSDEDRIRPIRSVLLSNIKEVSPFDPDRPREIEIIFPNNKSGRAEFDTEESAHDWRRELNGALFLDRHRRREAMGPASDETRGIRISCPLHKIDRVVPGSDYLTLIHFPGAAEGLEQDRCFLGPIVTVPAWHALPTYIEHAKRRASAYGDQSQTPVYIDFGPLTFAENTASMTLPTPHSTDQVVRSALSLGNESDLWIVRGALARNIASTGYFVVSPYYVGFWSKRLALSMSEIKYRLPAKILRSTKPYTHRFLRIFGFILEVEGFPDFKFQFRSQDTRDAAVQHVNDLIASKSLYSPSAIDGGEQTSPQHQLFQTPPLTPRSAGSNAIDLIAPPARTRAVVVAVGFPPNLSFKLPKVINIEKNLLTSQPSLHFVCLTIGSRGDVQPYIALGIGLKREGHEVTIVTHEEYKEWIESFGLRHRQAGGDPGALMKLSVENKMFSPEFFKKSLANFRPWLDQLLLDSWEACKDADVLLESPSAMAGVHIAEALHIPYFRTFTMPWTKTAEFPHAFLSPPVGSPLFNSASYVLFNNVMWAATSGQINRWRRNTLKISNTDMGHLMQEKIVFIYNFSTAVVPKPIDWGDATIISGYWFLDNPDPDWEQPPSLIEWMEKARSDGKPIVYIGFGSITVPRPNRVTSAIVQAVVKSDVRAIISKGWSARMNKDDKDPEPTIPPECYMLDKVPHDWLFPRIDAALHHGGAGTTGASLRAGIPTLIKPWFGDQFFWAERVQKLGAGMRVPSLRVGSLVHALTRATRSRTMKEKAALVGEKIRSEDGVRTAIYTIYTYLPRAGRDRTLLK
ncbi:UDP-Glycosyltransferase/glycogen phosphorylase [Dendrothele bispora CBS 962.96]|uniref:sterol 3beta-glucosyltransferase n=1 Tax=Dendrothele bispora (strain CBS 962.96) TaxID=1314807 RepID=A0A4S8MQQ6_DENBC|nr:UDP-Glycosyltransferase/glycogen phosphorylase [Dendrothele bispora CBS 962.96]